MSVPSSPTAHARPLPADGPLAALVERLVEDMGKRWRQGECPRTEAYLEQHPELVEQPEAALELVYEEVCLSREHGRALTEADVARRFPQWRKKLQILFGFHHLLETGPAPPVFPGIGEIVGDFKLLAKLGRGAQGHVFLATQPGLADRAVVLKLTPCRGQEHLSLARLQHTHIVPLYSAHHFTDRNLRALCMPYFGGATLANLLEALAQCPPAQRSGKHFLEALRQLQAAAALAVPVEGPLCRFLEGATYTQAICWLAACLADALHYARAHGLVHLDIKPSNVLVAADGQPMLLDFHLARAPLAQGAAAPDWLGGTPAYMAPEQWQAVEAVRKRQPLPAAVDERADVYALGMLLFEALGGPMPLKITRPGSQLRRYNPQVSVGLGDIVTRCLAADPARRYPDTALLATDLRLHLADRPLRGVANRSLVERWRKWRRRRPHAFAIAGLLLAVLGAVLGAAALALNRYAGMVDQAEGFLDEGIKCLADDKPEEAQQALKRGLKAVEELPYVPSVARRLHETLARADRARAVDGFHRFMEKLRGMYGEGVPPLPAWTKIDEYCQLFWHERTQIARPLAQNRQDLMDLAVIWTDLRVRRAGKDAASARRKALAVLEEAEKLCGGPSAVLCRERAAHAAALGMANVAKAAMKQAESLPLNTAWEHYAVGRGLLRDGDLDGAAAEFDRALSLQRDLWPTFCRGKCAYQRGHFDEALTYFYDCVTMTAKTPNAWCLANEGLAYAALGKGAQALDDFNKALKLDDTLAVAVLNRGLVHFRAGRYEPALADLQKALTLGSNAAEVHHDLALVYLAQGNRAAARASVQQALQNDPTYPAARALAERLKREP